MRIKIQKGSDPLGLCNYILDEAKQAAADRVAGHSPILATNMFGRDAAELTEEFRFIHNTNPRVKRTMVHYAVSLPPGEKLGNQEMIALSQALLHKAGHGNCQYLIARHHDQEEKHDVQHWHIATSAIDRSGHWVDDAYIKYRLKDYEQELAQEFNLSYLPPRSERDRDNLPTGEYRRKQRTGETLPREKLRAKLQQHTADQPTMAMLIARLKAEAIGVRLWQQDGEIKGITYDIDGWVCQGYKLGRVYSFSRLKQHLHVGYEPEQAQEILQIEQMTVEQCCEWLRLHDLRYREMLNKQHPQTDRARLELNSSQGLDPTEDLEVGVVIKLFNQSSDQQAIERSQAAVEAQAQDQERKRKIYHELYEQYASQLEAEPTQRDLLVAQQALQAGQSAKTVVLILEVGGKQAGQANARIYAASTTQVAIEQMQQQATQAKQQAQSPQQEDQR